jgi:NAD(P)-dependent dehydrogenase (short-subunit alcohol dehydrogenase family)
MSCFKLKEEKNFVISTARDLSAKALQDLAAIYPKNRLALIELDVTDVTSAKTAAEEAAALLPNGLDYLINNAGISLQMMTSFEDLCVSHV